MKASITFIQYITWEIKAVFSQCGDDRTACLVDKIKCNGFTIFFLKWHIVMKKPVGGTCYFCRDSDAPATTKRVNMLSYHMQYSLHTLIVLYNSAGCMYGRILPFQKLNSDSLQKHTQCSHTHYKHFVLQWYYLRQQYHWHTQPVVGVIWYRTGTSPVHQSSRTGITAHW